MVNSPERFAIARWMPVLLVGGLVAALVAAVLIVLAGRAESADRGYREHLAELTVLAGSMPAQAAAAARGDAAAFDRLAASRTTLERVLGEIDEGRSPFAALSSRERAAPRRGARLEHAARVLEAGAGRAQPSPASSASPRRSRARSSGACSRRPAMPFPRPAA